MTYDKTFFDSHEAGAISAARVILPLALELVSPCSVIDVGCGRGAWLKVCTELGVTDIRGIDGPHVDRATLLIEQSQFASHDLCTPLKLDRRADLALCLEVAEHLPLFAARPLVGSLTALAPCVLFSAAIPGQGGTHHINEQWPSFWESLFRQHGYQRLDPIRWQVYQDDSIPWWYRQNVYLYASEERIASSSALQAELSRARAAQLDIVATHVLGQVQTTRGLAWHTLLAAARAAKATIARRR